MIEETSSVLKTILVALDGSEISPRVVETLSYLVLSPDAKVIFCHVFPPPEPKMDIPADRPVNAVGFPSVEMEKQLQSYMDKLSVNSELELVHGEPSDEIVRLANIHQADLIVIGSRGLTGIKRIIQGSVSSEVIEAANCSVIVVK